MELKRLLLIVCCIVSGFLSRAQDDHFVYLQTENGKPFYVRLNNKVLSSTASGYLILPKLKEGQYVISVGFPKNTSPEEIFTIDLKDKSQGFLLKDFDEGGWSLFNLQTMALVSSGAPSPSAQLVVHADTTELKEDRFSQMLATVMKDSTLLRRSEKPEPLKTAEDTPSKVIVAIQEKTTEASIADPAGVKTDSVKKNESAIDTGARADHNGPEGKNDQDSRKSEMIYSPATVTSVSLSRILNVTGKDGSEMIYVDKGDNFSDTIRIFMPALKAEVLKDAAVESGAVTKEPEYTITPTIIPDTNTKQSSVTVLEKPDVVLKEVNIKISEEKKPAASQVFIIKADTEKKEKNKKEDSVILLPPVSATVTNNNCKSLATEDDYMKIRRKMASERNKNDMVNAARKAFRKKCFNTEQIRQLSYLFFEDEGRYMFFDAVYPYTADVQNFESLVSQLSEEYYINRFKAMIQKP